jgi:prepilin-type N-terminal cleavage/methylation domain-containing protein
MRFASTGSPAAWLWNAYGSLIGCLLQATRRRRSASGFTLIEALVAIVILASSLSVLLSAHDTALRGAAALDSHLQARLLAQSLLAQYALSRVPPQAHAQGRSGRFAWTVAVAPLEEAGGKRQDGPEQWSLHQLTVTVAWAPRRQITLTTLRLLSAP